MADFSSANYTHLFPTPLLGFIWPDGPELNEELRPLILRQAESTAGMSKTNVNGWHSETGQLEFCGAAGRRLVRHMYEMADEVLAACSRRPVKRCSQCAGHCGRG